MVYVQHAARFGSFLLSDKGLLIVNLTGFAILAILGSR